MPTPPTRATQKDVAKLAGVHTSTVSMALRDHPAIAGKTRARILAAAAELNYCPDPMLSALSQYRRTIRSPTFQGEVAWLAIDSPTYRWRAMPVNMAFFDGASAQATKRGYSVTECNLGEPGMTPRRANEILRARNVHGLLVCPLGTLERALNFHWEHYASVAIGYTLLGPELNVVSFDHFHSTQRLFGELSALGYQRIGLACPAILDQRTRGFTLAAFLREQLAVPAARRIPPFLPADKPSKPEFERWLTRYRPDGLITTHYFFPELLSELKVQVPGDIGFAVLFRKGSHDGFAGMEQNPRHIGEVAMNHLAGMIERYEHGIPTVPQQLLVAGEWAPGYTVRNQR